jgi:hypothetical protein
VGEAQRLGSLEDEKRRLKHLVADLRLGKEALKAIVRKNGWSLRASNVDIQCETDLPIVSEERLMIRRLRRKRLVRAANEGRLLVRSNQTNPASPFRFQPFQL